MMWLPLSNGFGLFHWIKKKNGKTLVLANNSFWLKPKRISSVHIWERTLAIVMIAREMLQSILWRSSKHLFFSKTHTTYSTGVGCYCFDFVYFLLVLTERQLEWSGLWLPLLGGFLHKFWEPPTLWFLKMLSLFFHFEDIRIVMPCNRFGAVEKAATYICINPGS